MLAATESRVDAKIAQLKDLQGQITALLAQRDAAQEKQVAALVKTYSAMKPKDAARIFNSLDDDVLVPVAQEMKSDVMAPVLAAMNPDAAQKLTLKLANKLALPDTMAAGPLRRPRRPAARRQRPARRPPRPPAQAQRLTVKNTVYQGLTPPADTREHRPGKVRSGFPSGRATRLKALEGDIRF